MNKILVIVLCFAISGCGGLSAAEPTATITPTIMETITPISTNTVVPSLTPTPAPQGIEFDYLVSISSYDTISISITLSNTPSTLITLYRLATPTLDSLPPLSEVNVTDGDGNKINYAITTWEGAADRHLELLKIVTDHKKIVVSYELNLLSQKYWQATPKYIALAENQIFFQPDPDRLDVAKLQFVFVLPSNWKIATRLTPTGNSYTANIKDTFRVVTYNFEWQRFYLGAPLAIGEIEVIETPFDDVRTIAAYPSGQTQYAEDASYVSKIYSYQRSVLGDSSRHIGDYAFVYFFGAKTLKGDLITTVESHGTFEVDHVRDNRHLAHEMYHAWWGGLHFLPEAWRFILIPDWFAEGSNEYLGVKAHFASGAFTSDMLNRWQKQFYSDYLSLAGTSKDVPLIKCYDLPFRSSAWVTCLYSKSHNVLFLLDKTLLHLTDQKVGIESLYKYLLEKYPTNLKNTKRISENEILIATNHISGYDFKPFFDAYIYGNEPFPIKIINGQLEVDFEKLPEMKKY